MKAGWKILIVLFAVVLAGVALWAVLLKQDVTPGPAREKSLRDLAASKDVVIYFNSGGWGNTPVEQATDFTPVLFGIQNTLTQLGYSSVIIPFVRATSGISGKVIDLKDFLVSFKYSGQALANEVNFIAGIYPGKKVIIVGYSNGGALTEKAMQGLGDNTSVYAVVAGVPRWFQDFTSSRLLILTNNGRDRYSAGNIGALAVAFVEAPYKWLRAKIEHRPLNFARAIEIPGHQYPWVSGLVGPPIMAFIDTYFKSR